MIRWMIFLAIFGVIDFYAFQSFKTLIKSFWLHYLYFLVSILVIGNFIYELTNMNGITIRSNIAIGLFLTLYLPKIFMMLIMFGEDIIRLPQAAYSFFTENDGSQSNHFPSRRKFVSHDPSHWEQQVISDDYHYHLTLSGHTHGMQFGIEIPGWIKWSPVKWRYKYWAGIYKEQGQYINVNRGFGFLAYPGRVGIWPEITVIELKKSINKV